MGKKSLIKSTSKKKSAAKAKAAKVAKAAKAKKEVPEKKSKASSAAKTETKPTSIKAADTQKKSKAMAPSKESKKPTLKALLFKKFDRQEPQQLYAPEVAPSDEKKFIPPPLIQGKNKTETARIKKLLFNQYSMEEVIAAAKAAPAPAAKKSASRPISRKELIFKKFEGESPQKLYKTTPPKVKPEDFLPRSFLDDKSKADADRIRRILKNQYSMADLAAAAQKAAAKPKPKKKPSRKELIFKAFEIEAPSKVYKVSPPQSSPEEFLPASFLAGRPKAEADRIRQILKQQYNMEDLKAAAEKKAAEEKAAAEKAAAEKKAAEEKAAAEKAAAEKKAAEEKAAAEKAAAEKKAAEEKAAAEKAAAEKAAAEKKAAEEKAAAEKAAAEKAAAEKKAAEEKAAAEKAAAEPQVKVTYEPPPSQAQKESAPVDRGIKMFAAGIGFLFLLIIIASVSNSGNYYLKYHKGNLEIWKGRFAPLGESRIVLMTNVEEPEELKELYSKKEVYPLAFDYYISMADQLLETDKLPNFESIKEYASKALEFSITADDRTKALARLNKIDQLILIYKADIAYSQGTIESLEQAESYLDDAADFNSDEVMTTMITSKQEKIAEAISALKGEGVVEEAEEKIEKETEPAPEATTKEPQDDHTSNQKVEQEENTAENRAEEVAETAHEEKATKSH